MGMFDTIRCEYPLPDADHQNLEFQTKSLECLLDEYTITRDGKLVRHANRGPFGRPGLVADVEWPIHGDIEIYQSLERAPGKPTWVEYIVRFTHGRVEWVRAAPKRAAAVVTQDVPRALVIAPLRRHSLAPGLEGRRLTEEEFLANMPEKLELLDGHVPGEEDLLVALLVSVGLRRAGELVGSSQWYGAK